MAHHDPFKALRPFAAGGRSGQLYSLPALEQAGLGKISRLPVSVRLVLESTDGLAHKAMCRLSETERQFVFKQLGAAFEAAIELYEARLPQH